MPECSVHLLNSNVDELDSFMHSVLPESEEKPRFETATTIKDETISRGKGRPKGEKNNKNKERRNKSSITDENRRRGHWSLDENKKYHWFLEIYNKHFICKEMRRLDKIFKTMATFIGTR